MRKLAIIAISLLLGSCLEAKKAEPVLNIIPEPQSVSFGKGEFKVKGANFNYDSFLTKPTAEAIAKLADDIYISTGKVSSVAVATGVNYGTPIESLKGVFFLKDPTLAAEEYRLEVSPKAVKVTASDLNGFLYAIATFRQMLPVEVYAGKQVQGKITIPCCTIQDKPRFDYRGLELDCARHFYNVDQVKRLLDVMAMYKLNRFHWHLTEDQGWRLEIKKYPLLTEIGAFRSGTQQTYERGKNDGKRYGGYYTQDQVREVVEYAGKLGIIVIPELDLPGHMLGALASYPWLGCTGGPYQVWTRWGVCDQVLCVGKETTFQFLFDVLDEICELFPSEYIHIGGDECPKKEWDKCPACTAKMDELGLVADEKGTRGQKLQNYVTKRVQDYLASKGRKIIGWDEILEGELAEGATVMSWRGTKGGIKAAGLGFDVIMSPSTYCYLDYKQGETEADNLAGAGYTKKGKIYDAKNLYSYEPLEGLDDAAAAHILGVQGNVWTEYIRNEEQLYFMVIPRLQALSEVQWTVPANRSYDRLVRKMKDYHFRVMDAVGYNYRPL
jgi:hexosaminidase